MSIRALTYKEKVIANAVVELGVSQGWEFAAYLKAPDGDLIEFITRMEDDGADPSSDVKKLAKDVNTVVVHHNHLSQESLSVADWRGVNCIFNEIFAHSSDGTIYYGKVLNKSRLKEITEGEYNKIVNKGENNLFNLLNDDGLELELEIISSFFRKEVVNRAMALKKIVEYEYSWGVGESLPYNKSGNKTIQKPGGNLGDCFNKYINDAAKTLSSDL